MKKLSIETMDKTRYSFLLRLTAGWILGFGGFILKDYIKNYIVFGIVLFVGLVGWLLFSFNLFQFLKFGKTVNSNKELKHALNDELIKFNKNKSITVGYWTLLILTSGFLLLSFFINIPALIICELILYIGIASTLISLLIFNRG